MVWYFWQGGVMLARQQCGDMIFMKHLEDSHLIPVNPTCFLPKRHLTHHCQNRNTNYVNIINFCWIQVQYIHALVQYGGKTSLMWPWCVMIVIPSYVHTFLNVLLIAFSLSFFSLLQSVHKLCKLFLLLLFLNFFIFSYVSKKRDHKPNNQQLGSVLPLTMFH